MSRTTESIFASLAASQWGMLTAAQATGQGIARSTLLRREQSGALERVRSGVYRLAGAPVSRLDDIRAAWLVSEPGMQAWERLAVPDAIVGGAAAAWVHEIGDLYPSPIRLYTTMRRQTKHDDIKYSSRRLPSEDIAVIDGLPVTTRERTIADLLDEPGADLSLVADALRDAERSDSDVDADRLVSLMGTHSRRLGYTSGAKLYEHLRSVSRIDEERLRNLLAHTNLPDLVGSLANDRIHAVLAPLLATLAEQANDIQTAAAFAALRASLLANLNDQVKAAILPGTGITIPKINLPVVKVPRVQLPPGLLSGLQLSPETEAALRKLATTPMPTLSPATEARIAELATGATIRKSDGTAPLPPRKSPSGVTPNAPTMPLEAADT
jgi:predicted transcriptional regulator of viral defense system